MDPSDLSGFATAAERVIEGSPVIVVVLGAIGLVVWRTWRQERGEMMTELREERAARAKAHEQMVTVVERSTEAVHAVREALTELRRAIKSPD
jgi:threonine dehydrogenase-like Zn-dependent dehydrogenase